MKLNLMRFILGSRMLMSISMTLQSDLSHGKRLLRNLKIKEISIVIAMAGSGTRTSDKYDSPKPLIMLEERPLFSWALEGLPKDISSDIRVITSGQVARHPEFESLMKRFMPTSLKFLELLNPQTLG